MARNTDHSSEIVAGLARQPPESGTWEAARPQPSTLMIRSLPHLRRPASRRRSLGLNLRSLPLQQEVWLDDQSATPSHDHERLADDLAIDLERDATEEPLHSAGVLVISDLHDDDIGLFHP